MMDGQQQQQNEMGTALSATTIISTDSSTVDASTQNIGFTQASYCNTMAQLLHPGSLPTQAPAYCYSYFSDGHNSNISTNVALSQCVQPNRVQFAGAPSTWPLAAPPTAPANGGMPVAYSMVAPPSYCYYYVVPHSTPSVPSNCGPTISQTMQTGTATAPYFLPQQYASPPVICPLTQSTNCCPQCIQGLVYPNQQQVATFNNPARHMPTPQPGTLGNCLATNNCIVYPTTQQNSLVASLQEQITDCTAINDSATVQVATSSNVQANTNQEGMAPQKLLQQMSTEQQRQLNAQMSGVDSQVTSHVINCPASNTATQRACSFDNNSNSSNQLTNIIAYLASTSNQQQLMASKVPGGVVNENTAVQTLVDILRANAVGSFLEQQQKRENALAPNQQSPQVLQSRKIGGGSEPANNSSCKPYETNILYKTVLCRDFARSGTCPRDVNCTFAHGEQDLHRPENHVIYKRDMCPELKQTGRCSRGSQCYYAHRASELRV
jgi:hypothetical protein